MLIKRDRTGLKHSNDSKAVKYSNDRDDIYNNIDKYKSNKKCEILIIFDHMTDMLSNKKLNSIVTELFIRGRKLNICLVFITKSHFAVPKNITSNSSCYCIKKIPNKREHEKSLLIIHQIFNFKTLWIYIKNILQKHIFLVIDATLASDNPLSFRKNFVVRI